MEVKKKWKRYVLQIIFTCLLISSVVYLIPDLVYADSSDLPSYDSDDFDGLLLSSESVKTDFTDGNGVHVNCEISASGSKKVYLIKYQDSYTFVSREPFSYTSHYTLDDGTLYSNKKDTSSLAKCNHYQFYICPVLIPGDELDCVYYSLPDWETLKKMKDSNPSKYDSIPFHFYGGLMNDIQCMKMYSVEGKRAPGSVDNPIEDPEIGTIIIPKYRFQGYYRDSEDENDCDFTFQWKNKTSTGFSLTKNKYAHTVIQCRVQSRCVVYKDLAHKQILKEFKNFGESAILYNSINVENNPYSIAYSYIKEKLPETMKEIHNPLYVGYEYRFFFRVMCSDDLAVIPGGSGKWYAGGWRSVDLNASAKNEQNPNTSNGHFDDDGNWVTDKDDGNNSTDGGSTVSKDKDDARDDFANGDGKTGDSTSFDWNSFKGLINQCKEVPGLIKSVFSFLPDWVLVFIAIGFGIWIFVLIKRAIV